MATETKEYTCPADGCDYSGTEDSVAAHYSGTRKKPDHSGGYERAKQRMGSEPVTEPQDSDDTDSTETESVDSQGDAGSNTSHPTFGDGQDADTDSKGTGGGKDVELPCGCESFSTSNAPEPPFWVTCETCGKSFQVTEL